MPVCLDGERSGHNLLAGAECLRGKSPVEFRESDASCIHIGLINNMPDAALEATERQFLALLDAAADGMVVRLTLYALPDVPRTDLARRHVSRFYSGIDDLWDSHLDGLIVTGTEPQAPNLMDEPYWESLTRVLEWAEHNTHSTCLVLPGRACGSSPRRWHRPAYVQRKALRHLRVRASLRSPIDGRRSVSTADAAFQVERHSGGRTDVVRLSRSHAVGRCGRRHVREAAKELVRLLPGSSGI